MKKGILFGVSVGPGDPELMTLKAVNTINNCRYIIVPRTRGEKTLALSIAQQCCSLEGKEIMPIDFPMTHEKSEWNAAHEEAAERIVHILETGSDCAMLCLGDASVYSTFSYTAERVREHGFEVCVIAGVTSFCAAAARLGEPLVTGSSPLVILPPSAEDFHSLVNTNGTVVIMKSGKQLERVKSELSGHTVAAVSDCGLPSEKVFTSLEELPDSGGYFTLVIAKKQ